MELLSPLILAVAALGCARGANLVVNMRQGNVSHFALDAFIEPNINRGDDGGLYAELKHTSYLVIPGWSKFGGVSWFQDPDTPLKALNKSLQVYIPANSSITPGQQAGVENAGWFGLPINPEPYNFSFWVNQDGHLDSPLQVSLVSKTTNQTYASTTFPTSSLKNGWNNLKTILHPNDTAPDTNNVLRISTDALTDRDQYFWINLVSLFPPTFGNSTVLRRDLANAVADLKAKRIRIPGGSNMQGSDMLTRFFWKNSIGPLEERPGRPGYWIGYQTEGLGLKEMLDMVEQFGATPVLGIYDAYSSADESIPNNTRLDPYIQEAVDELQFVLGDPKTNKWAKMRADLGHPEPYNVQHIEIGNEDFTSPITYRYRWQRFYDALKSEFPHLNYIASSSIQGVDLPAVDVHDYSGPDFFYQMFSRYDNWPRNGTTIWELEFGNINTNSIDPFGTPDTRLQTPTMQGSIAEAVFLIGMQRNGDLVEGASYAPFLCNNYSVQWTPNLIQFNISHIALSTSYHVMKMVSSARANQTHPVESDTEFGPLYWVASSTNNGSTLFFQVANINDSDTSATVAFQGLPAGATILNATSTVLSVPSGQPYNITNDLNQPIAVVPLESNFNVSSENATVTFEATVKGRSFSVYQIYLASVN